MSRVIPICKSIKELRIPHKIAVLFSAVRLIIIFDLTARSEITPLYGYFTPRGDT